MDEPIIAVAAVDGTVNLRRLVKNPSGRLEIQRKLFTQLRKTDAVNKQNC